ncbi:RuBisCO large subunit C-terminal-like domain-containing protein [Rhizobium hidalgonense]|uniref:RuBisCO large subunit C-terminal-like domain-containing protein n=1 Tax=Rhizobium hidalgonense TaxID=1538159 RepID=A0AAJ2LI03_9HYPH|nr:RuBisCO large subunit C-terminal-like domain-containing protein [Rhizobium hidalgonense]MDR9772740.1 RuBisCO large subunit C-terminal-like domain-containing protein [Rhizobium hidalgonense]MDR9820200.1 RuBisCO large subunit C-terminal-like domain-containing protein [Rhizobium hidalgonense]
MNWIRIKILFSVQKADGAAGTPDDAYTVAAQVKDDALFGTFAEIDTAFWSERMDRSLDTLSRFELGEAVDTTRGRYEFNLELAADLFPPDLGGYNHLFGILAGDLLRFVLPPLKVSDFVVKDIVFPDGWRDEHCKLFREYSTSIPEIRKALSIEDGMPLLAFSFKPRVGFKLDALEAIANDVLAAGFNVVELDTRFLPVNRAHLAQLREIAARIADKQWSGRSGRLSLNFTLPTPVLLEEIQAFCEQIPAPVVAKIDGGLNGIDSIQSVRRAKIIDQQGQPPIITCYPLLRNALSNYVPPDKVLDALILSGADVIYPGGRPDIGHMKRSLDSSVQNSFVQAVQRYRDLVQRQEAMPTIAGGIYAGQLHAYYELLGPDVGWVLGGGVTLHRDGPKAGAELCVDVARAAAELRQKAGRSWSANLSKRLVTRCSEAYLGTSQLSNSELTYFSPSENLNIARLAPFEVKK